MRSVSLTTSLAIAALLSGCVADPPPAEEIRQQALPTVALDGAWRADASASAEPVQHDWLHTFNDPQLDALVSEAIAQQSRPARRRRARRTSRAVPGRRTGVIAPMDRRLWHGRREDRRRRRQLLGTAGADAVRLMGARPVGPVALRAQRGRAGFRVGGRRTCEFAQQSLAASTAKAWFTATQLTLNAALAADMVQSANQLTLLAQDRERVGVGTDAETAVARATAKDLESTHQQLSSRAVRRCARSNCWSAATRPRK